MSEQVIYPLLVLVKGLLEGRNGFVVPLVQLGKPFIVDTYFEVALLSLDNGMAYSGAPDKPCGEDARMLTQNCR